MMTEENDVDVTDEKVNKSQSGPSLTSIVIGVLILIFAGSFAKAIVNSPKANWKTYTVGTIEPGVSLAAPSEPKLLNVEYPEALLNMTKKVEYYECYSKADRVRIQIVGATYNSNIISSLQGAINGAVGDVANLSGATNVQHTTAPMTISGRETTLLTITADVNGNKFEQKTLLFVNGSSFRQINIQYTGTDNVGKNSAQKAIASLSFVN